LHLSTVQKIAARHLFTACHLYLRKLHRPVAAFYNQATLGFFRKNFSVFCVFKGSNEVKEIVFSEDEFNEYQVKAWVSFEDIYFDFLDKAILDNGVEIISRTSKEPYKTFERQRREKDGLKQDIDND
jgi:hypothetical protein